MNQEVARYSRFRIRWPYVILTVLLFAVEVGIALWLHDRIIRPYIGDFLVVILMYCFFRSFLDIPPLKIAIGVLVFAYLIETLQYFHLVGRLGLSHSRLARTVLGSAFEWTDMAAYTAGICCTLFLERFAARNRLT